MTPGQSAPPKAGRGFTLLELMVVVSIVALASTGVTLALRDNDAQRLETEAVRLSALLEAARAQSRSQGSPVWWRPTAAGFEFIEKSPGSTAASRTPPSLRQWLHEGTRAEIVRPPGAAQLALGPEPLIAAQSLRLQLGARSLVLSTDGLAPFVPTASAP